MKYSCALKLNHIFRRLYHTSAVANGFLVLYARPNHSESNRVGITVSKKLGCAVVRNRIKRRLRAACAPLLSQMKPGLYVFIARQGAITADFDKLCRSMQYLLRRQNLLLPEDKQIGKDDEKAGEQA